VRPVLAGVLPAAERAKPVRVKEMPTRHATIAADSSAIVQRSIDALLEGFRPARLNRYGFANVSASALDCWRVAPLLLSLMVMVTLALPLPASCMGIGTLT